MDLMDPHLTASIKRAALPTVEDGGAENTNQHWVASLFPPTYTFNNLGEKSPEEMRSLLSLRISTLDGEALRNVYERVQAMLMMGEELKRQEEQQGSVEEEPEPPAPAPPDLDDSCIWDEGEMRVLRQAYKSIRDTNRKLTVALELTDQQLDEFKRKFTQVRTENDENSRGLHEARQANTRLHIMSETLKKDLDQERVRTKTLQEQLESLSLERLDMLDRVQQARTETNQHRVEKKRLELEVREHGRTLIEASAHLEGKLRLQYERDINELRRTVADLREELANEKERHAAARRGLDHLRTHFANLPVDQVLKKDELAKVKLY